MKEDVKHSRIFSGNLHTLISLKHMFSEYIKVWGKIILKIYMGGSVS